MIERVRSEAGILCLRAATVVARVPGCYWLTVGFVLVAVIVLPEEIRKLTAVKLQWERARKSRERQEQADGRVQRGGLGASAKRAG